MHILLTVHQFFPEYKAGTEVLTLSVAQELTRLGHQVRIFAGYPETVSMDDEKRFDEYDYEGIHVYRFHHDYIPMAGQVSKVELGYNNQLALRFFSRVFADFSPDLVHYFHLNRLGIGLIDYLARTNVPQFFTPTDFWMICATAQLMLGEGRFCNGPDSHAGNCIKHFAKNSQNHLFKVVADILPNRVVNQFARITKANQRLHYPMCEEVRALSSRLDATVGALNRLQGIVSPNRFMTDLFIRYGVEPQLIHECDFGITLHDSNSVRTCPKSKDDSSPLEIGFIGTLAPHKGCHILVKAFNQLPENTAVLKIYGSAQDFPDYYDALLSLADGNESIFFCGTFPNASINTIMHELDVLVVPSVWYENTPLVIYSAQAAQCPVIGSDLPGIASVIKHKYNGLLFEAGNVDALIEQILMLKEQGVESLSKNAILPKTIHEYVNTLDKIWKIHV